MGRLIFVAETKGLSDSHLRHIGANGPLSLRKIQTSPSGLFSSTDAPNPAITDCERFVHTATPSGIKNTPYGAFFIPGGDEVFPRPADGGAVGHS